MFKRLSVVVHMLPLVFAGMIVSNQAGAQPRQEISANRNMAECSARATFIRLAIDAYGSQARIAKFRSQQGAVDYVIEQTANQNLKKKESEAVIRRIVRYVYDVLKPSTYSPNEMVEITNVYHRRCMFDPDKKGVGSLYIVDLEKAFSKNTDGEFVVQNKDGRKTVCHKGECKAQSLEPPQGTGKTYAETRKIVESLGWTPAPSEMRQILIKTGRLYTNGKKFDTNEIYGNCLIENSICDKSKPELADCTEAGECTAVWTKNGATVWYLIQNGLVEQFGSAPANFAR